MYIKLVIWKLERCVHGTFSSAKKEDGLGAGSESFC